MIHSSESGGTRSVGPQHKVAVWKAAAEIAEIVEGPECGRGMGAGRRTS